MVGAEEGVEAQPFRSLGDGQLILVRRAELRLEEYAKLCHRSLSSFKREFQSHFSESPGKWLLQKRLEYASSLLRNSVG